MTSGVWCHHKTLQLDLYLGEERDLLISFKAHMELYLEFVYNYYLDVIGWEPPDISKHVNNLNLLENMKVKRKSGEDQAANAANFASKLRSRKSCSYRRRFYVCFNWNDKKQVSRNRLYRFQRIYWHSSVTVDLTWIIEIS